MIFFFQQQKILTPQEICCGEAGNPAAQNNDGRLLGGSRALECASVTNFMANLIVLTVDHWNRGLACRRSPQGGIDGAPGSNRPSDHKLDEITTRLRHALSYVL